MEAIITESTFKEVYQYFKKHYSKKLADQFASTYSQHAKLYSSTN